MRPVSALQPQRQPRCSPVTDADILQSATDRVSLAGHVEPIETSGTHTFFTGQQDGHAVFIKHNRFDRLVKGAGPLSAVNPVFSGVLYKALPNLDRLQDMSETMLSHFLQGYFEDSGRPYSGVTYREALFIDPRTHKPTLGIAAPMVPHLGSLEKVPARDISNPQQAVELTLIRGLLFGDYDVVFHDDNTPVIEGDGHMSDGTAVKTGQSLAMDFGEAGNDGLGRFGVPFANAKLLQQFPQDVKPAVDRILQLDADHVRKLVADGGTHVTGWTPQLTEHYTRILTDNLDKIRTRLAADPTWLDPAHSTNWMRRPGQTNLKMVLLAVPSALHNYGRVGRSGVLNSIRSTDDVASVLTGSRGQDSGVGGQGKTWLRMFRSMPRRTFPNQSAAKQPRSLTPDP